jgi:hypothetical protein
MSKTYLKSDHFNGGGSLNLNVTTVTPVSLIGYDVPNTTSTSYTVQIKSALGNTVTFGFGKTAIIEVWELMS